MWVIGTIKTDSSQRQ